MKREVLKYKLYYYQILYNLEHVCLRDAMHDTPLEKYEIHAFYEVCHRTAPYTQTHLKLFFTAV